MNLETKKTNNEQDQSNKWEIPNPEFDYCGPMGKDSIDYTHRVIINNRYFQIFIGLLFLILFMLIYSYFKLSNNLTAVVKMPNYGEIKIGKMQSDPLYYRVWGDYILNYFANFTPTDISERIEKGLVIFDKDVLIEKKPEVEAYYQSIKTNRIIQNFKFIEQKVKVELEDSGGSATIVYPGVATQRISDLVTRKKDCSYEMHFFINNGEIIQDAIKTDCLDDNSIVPKGDSQTKKISTLVEEPTEEEVSKEASSQKDKAETSIQNKEVQDYKIKIDNDFIMQDLKNNPIQKIDSEISNKKVDNSTEITDNNKDEESTKDVNNKNSELEKELNTKEKGTYE